MNNMEFTPLLPLIILGATSVLIMIITAIKRDHLVTSFITLAGLAAAFISLFFINHEPQSITPLLISDRYSQLFTGLFIAATAAISLLSYDYLNKKEYKREEYYILLTLALLGSCILAFSKHFVSLFLGLEILSVSLYALIAYFREYERAVEAGIKYLVLAAASSAFLLFGMGLVYFETGTMDFNIMAQNIPAAHSSIIFIAGIGIMIIGVGFKLAVVPFHLWTPDVYQGASSPVTAFIASVSKGGMFAVLFRFFTEINGYNYPVLLIIFTVIAIASMTIGNLLAIFQQNIKRLLAYSSISHFGYMLAAFIAGGTLGVEAVIFYLAAYFITIIIAFGIISLLSDPYHEPEDIIEYSGLFWRRPWISLFFTLVLLSLAGIPLTAGFIGKFYVAAAGVDKSLWLLLFSLIINSAIGLFYYLRVITSFYSNVQPEEDEEEDTLPLSGVSVIIILSVILLWLGVYPAAFMELIQGMVRVFQ